MRTKPTEEPLSRVSAARDSDVPSPVPWLVAAAVFIIVCLRSHAVFLSPHFWAEDGAVFWVGTYESGLGSWFEPYAGYLHLAPRIFAWLAFQLPYLWHPVAFALGGALATSLPDWRLGAALGIALVLVRQDIGEIFLTLTNAQWIMACALPILVVSPVPERRAWRANQLVFLGITTLTGPFGAMLIPLWIAGLYCTVRREGWFVHGNLLAAVGILGGLIQIGVVVFSDTTDVWSISARQLPVIVLRVFSDGFGGSRDWSVAILVIALLGATLLFARYRLLRLAAAYLALAVMGTTALKFGGVSETAFESNWAGARYFFIPVVMMAFMAVSSFFERGRPYGRLLGAVLVALLVAGTIRGGFYQPKRADLWQAWVDASGKIGHETVTVPVHPPYFNDFMEMNSRARDEQNGTGRGGMDG